MGIFGRNKINEQEAAALFVREIFVGVRDRWPGVARELNQLTQLKKEISDDDFAGFEFAIAVIAYQLQILKNLFSSEQADRLRSRIVSIIVDSEYGDYAAEAISIYENAWIDGLKSGCLPYENIASILYEKLDCADNFSAINGVEYKNPILILALSEKVITFYSLFWKKFLKDWKIDP